ncbi:adenosylcobinamide amidohydrolase [Rhodococcus sp. X156]|uniref:adenosylcobinamide amidohydrolase n=1 Tax=Rhodococcus sp. X156 TaxID=2499145 RepID=UPI001F4972DF|nr:adenosylcobinamide amidohydrolase [Rhodococcus sp. X156]
MHPTNHVHDGHPLQLWVSPTPWRAISSAPLGGGVGLRGWVVNATVPADYGRTDPEAHLREIAEHLGLGGPGVGLLTAVDVRAAVTVEQDGVVVTATTGVGAPTWAAAGAAAVPYRPGTINVVVQLPVALTDAALVNLVGTVTEAKTQAMLTFGVAGTGTATDTVTALCPPPALCPPAPCPPAPEHDGAGAPEVFGGTRSVWGSRTASAVFDAVTAGLVVDRARIDALTAQGYQPWPV